MTLREIAASRVTMENVDELPEQLDADDAAEGLTETTPSAA
jgi:hypothetical protein